MKITRRIIEKGLRFASVGVFVCGLDFLLVALFKRLIPTMAAVSVAYFLAVATHYCLNKWWVFQSRSPVQGWEVVRYILAVLACWLCTVTVVWLMLHSFTTNVFIAKLVALGPAAATSFSLMRWFVFPRPRTVPGAPRSAGL